VFVRIQNNNLFGCVGGCGEVQASVCVYTYIQYDAHIFWQLGEERADRAGAMSAGRAHTAHKAFMDSLSTPSGSIHTDGRAI